MYITGEINTGYPPEEQHDDYTTDGRVMLWATRCSSCEISFNIFIKTNIGYGPDLFDTKMRWYLLKGVGRRWREDHCTCGRY